MPANQTWFACDSFVSWICTVIHRFLNFWWTCSETAENLVSWQLTIINCFLSYKHDRSFSWPYYYQLDKLYTQCQKSDYIPRYGDGHQSIHGGSYSHYKQSIRGTDFIPINGWLVQSPKDNFLGYRQQQHAIMETIIHGGIIKKIKLPLLLIMVIRIHGITPNPIMAITIVLKWGYP